MCSKIPAAQNEGICIVPVGRGGVEMEGSSTLNVPMSPTGQPSVSSWT